ncbi:MAG: hypothetical protein RQ862_10245 [Candidatus Caldarchaeales archaeon]|nr:hypothetical protein [Candidatus Caldarchaeales archaeon]
MSDESTQSSLIDPLNRRIPLRYAVEMDDLTIEFSAAPCVGGRC